MSVDSSLTPEDSLAMPEEKSLELVDGQPVERNKGAESSWIGLELGALMRQHAKDHKLGWVLPADVGYQCYPEASNQVRKPDDSFIRFGRLPDEELPRGYLRIVPDLAVEVVSPNVLADVLDQ